MVCPFDRAQALEQRQRDQAINAQLAQAKIEQAHALLAHHDIGGFDVTVQNILLVGVNQRIQ